MSFAQTPTRGIIKTGTTIFNYSSANPKVDPSQTENDMLVFDPALLYRRGADLTNGIVRTVVSSSTPSTIVTSCPLTNVNSGICIKMYKYNSSAIDGKGKFLYGGFVTTSSTSYTINPWKLPNSEVPYWFSPYLSTDIKELVKRATGNRTEGEFKVIVEVSIKNSNFIAFKIPGLGAFDSSLIFLTPGSYPKPNNFVSIGCHRGYWEGVRDPENSYSAIKKAIDNLYGMIELDMQTTSDNKVIVFHDMGLNKRTDLTGSVQSKSLAQLQGKLLKNRFDEIIDQPATAPPSIQSLDIILSFIKNNSTTIPIPWINLDRAANDATTFKLVYPIINGQQLVSRSIFKGRYPISHTDIITAFNQMNITNPETMKAIYFTPVLFDGLNETSTAYTEQDVQKYKDYIDGWINSGLADGFELTFKAYPFGTVEYGAGNANQVWILRKWAILGNKNFVEYVQSFGYPVGIFTSVPEVCAIPDFNSTTGARVTTNLVSGFVKENSTTFVPRVTDIGDFDFRGDWDFYVPAGVNYVLTDRPDALKVYLQAAGKYKPF
ncbi:glycerophosphodiester phosphodiesterase family protein [Pedobacter glucosidilyticus]|uniref:glycerophosphodiester phosphodiesterase family protein n=1 Tax=Pedobacter glucosidilyticus TaxID=1122941 RepID=UPI0026F30ACF|nr:glycerophosphodiester phosphodiesterase family protein [Pedobacter glucosidilyticus]